MRRLLDELAGSTALPLAVAGLVTASADAGGPAREYDPDVLVSLYNDNVDAAPDVVRRQLADERLAVTIDADGDEPDTYAVRTDTRARIDSYREGHPESPTYRVRTDAATAREIGTADNPKARARRAYNNGDLEVEGVGMANSVKVGAVKFARSTGLF